MASPNSVHIHFPGSDIALEDTEWTLAAAQRVADTFGLALQVPAALRHLAEHLKSVPPGIASKVADLDEITSAEDLESLDGQIDELFDGEYLRDFLAHFEWWVEVSRAALNGTAIKPTYGEQFPEQRELFLGMIEDVLFCYPKAIAQTIYFQGEQVDDLAHVELLKAYGLFRRAVLDFLSTMWPEADLSHYTHVP